MNVWEEYTAYFNDWRQKPEVIRIFRRIMLISVPLTGLGAMIISSWIIRGSIIPTAYRFSFFAMPVKYLITIPFAFLAWVHSTEHTRPLTLRFSLPILLLSMTLFMLASSFAHKHGYRSYSLALGFGGTVVGLGTFIPMREVWSRIKEDWRLTALALCAASLATLYILFRQEFWKQLCRSTGWIVYHVMNAMGADVSIKVKHSTTILYSTYFRANIHPACSGIDGISIFFFLLSMVIMFDWQLFKRLALLETFLIGFIYMFFVNALRITSLFAVGYHSWKPDASPMIKALRGTPQELFHSYIGMIYYLIGFCLFAAVLYRLAIRKAKRLHS